MKRPQSAKNGGRAGWAQQSNDGLSDQENNDNPHRNPRKKLKIMRPDFVTNDFARVLPKKIYQDKERLYSQALQLKQNLNETIEENTRLRTKIAILQKEKEKMSRYIESSEVGMGNKVPSRLNIYSSKPVQKQNTIVRNLKKMIRESRQQNEFLKQQNAKIKKAIKYTKINELQIQRKMLQDQNQKLSEILQQLNARVNQDADNQKKIKELTRYLQQEVQNNRQLSEANQNYIQYIESLEGKLKETEQKLLEKQKKLVRDLGLTKRKLNQQVKINDDLRREVRQLKEQKANISQNQPKKQFKRPTSSHPYTQNKKNQTSMTQQNASAVDINAKKQIEELKKRNITLANELQEVKKQLKQNDSKPVAAMKSNIKEVEMKGSGQLRGSGDLQLNSGKFDPEQPFIFQDDKNSQKESQNKQYQNDYEQEFQQQPDISQNKKSEIKVHQQEFNKKDEEKEESLYKKDDKNKKKSKKGGFKPNKKHLSAIKQLLTYRMKAQRYTYPELKHDIEISGEVNLHYIDLSKLLKGQPFFLDDSLSNIMLQYIFQEEKPKQDSSTTCQNFINKLRKVIEDYQMADQSQQQLMLLRIAQMTSSYPNELEAAFQNLKNGEGTISKQQLIKMFKGLQLAENYIQLIISELSMCSTDLQHLNYHGFFERFYLDESDQAQLQAINHPIDQEQVQSSGGSSRAIGIESNKKKQNIKQTGTIQEVKNEFQDQQDPQFIIDKDQKMQQLSMKMNNYDIDDPVSDDGNI